MTLRQPRYTTEEHARRGREIYEQQVRTQIDAGNHGRIVAIDIDSGEFEIADTTLAACERLLSRMPDAQIWCVCVGYPAVHRFGAAARSGRAPRSRSVCLVLALAAVLAILSLNTALAAQPATRPNIVFILADDLGYGDLGCYGQQQIQTPRIDRMAAEGVRFSQFYAGSTVCAPSRCVLMTGLHLGHAYIRGNARHSLQPEHVTVAELLHDAGYATGLFGKWGLGQEGSTGVPTRQGFDEFFGYLDQHHAHNYYPTFLMKNEDRVPLDNVVPGDGDFGQGVAASKVQYSPDLIMDEALDFIDRHRAQPFFLYLAVTLPHANNEARNKGMEIPDHGIYASRDWSEPQKGLAAMITRLDSDVGRVLDRLKRHGIDERTVVLFSSDNGPHAEGGNDPQFFDSNGPLRGIKRDLYEGGIRVPMIVRWPGRAPAGTVSDHAGYFGDFLATACELAGIKPDVQHDGLSFVPAILGRESEQQKHRALYWEFYERGSAQAVRVGDWKGVVKPLGGERVELYNLQTDLGETTDVAAEHPEIVDTIREVIRRSHKSSPLWKVAGRAAATRRSR